MRAPQSSSQQRSSHPLSPSGWRRPRSTSPSSWICAAGRRPSGAQLATLSPEHYTEDKPQMLKGREEKAAWPGTSGQNNSAVSPWGFFLPCMFQTLPTVSLQGEFQRKLYKELVKNYNPLERPVANDSQPLTVYFSLSLLQIMDVDEKNQVLTTNIWLQMSWTDHYLQWNVSEYPGVKTVRFPDGQIWKPDILLYNRLRLVNFFTQAKGKAL
uniref:Cholinergic receptor nicotinic alpha 7 subunit n=1 Tax=Callithrix jacchus TaxID=9483 RepID=A0A8I3WU26_CALJA